jgi:hypothetical protein
MGEWFIKIGKQYGVTGFLALWLLWTNQRLSRVEGELYKCYDRTVQFKTDTSASHNSISTKYYAILTKEEKYVDEKMESKNA